MFIRNTAMSFALLVDHQVAEAFLPGGIERVPDKTKRIQPLSAFDRHFLFAVTLTCYPLSQPEPAFGMFSWNQTMSLALLVLCETAETLLPTLIEGIPTKPED